MSPLEIVLAVLIGSFVIGYMIKSIYDLKHPEKVKARKEAKRLKKEEKKEKKNERTMGDDYE